MLSLPICKVVGLRHLPQDNQLAECLTFILFLPLKAIDALNCPLALFILLGRQIIPGARLKDATLYACFAASVVKSR